MLNSIVQSDITIEAFLICTAASIILGVGTALLCMFKNQCSQSFAVTLAILPAIVQIVIMLVNGNIGAGVAVAGAFSLIRFRSAAGSAREIGAIFLAMSIGLACGMGYIVIAVLFYAIMAVFLIILTVSNFGGNDETQRDLKITIPENLDYEGLFDDIFEKYTDSAILQNVKTANMGTLYELNYRIKMKEKLISKEFIDEIRCRNGNLNIVCGRIAKKDAL